MHMRTSMTSFLPSVRRFIDRRLGSSGIDGEVNVLLNDAIQGCLVVKEGQCPSIVLWHVVVLVDDLLLDVGD